MEAVAKLRNYPTSPRKMRLIADLIRGMKVDKALAVLEHNPKHSSEPVRKLLLSAISNWKQKNEGGDAEGLYVTTIFVDGARTLKRMRPAPQGRGYKIRKRSNHVTLMVNDSPTAKELKKTAAKKTYSSKVKNNSKTPVAQEAAGQ
jgi:large subunit ribosomal protein L22